MSFFKNYITFEEKLTFMNNRLLFPRPFKAVGLVLVALSFILFIAWNWYHFEFGFLATTGGSRTEGLDFQDHNLTNELMAIAMLTGLLFIAFARGRTEDERTALLRLQSLQVSQYVSYVLFVLGLFLVNGLAFISVMLLFPYVLLAIFILVYHCRMYLLPKFAAHEE